MGTLGRMRQTARAELGPYRGGDSESLRPREPPSTGQLMVSTMNMGLQGRGGD